MTTTATPLAKVASYAFWDRDGKELAAFYAAALGVKTVAQYPNEEGVPTAYLISNTDGSLLCTFYTARDYQAPAWPQDELPFHLDLSFDDVEAGEKRLLELAVAVRAPCRTTASALGREGADAGASHAPALGTPSSAAPRQGRHGGVLGGRGKFLLPGGKRETCPGGVWRAAEIGVPVLRGHRTASTANFAASHGNGAANQRFT
ncbi:VOC family protein [Streptomyces sp. NPDC088560]|uniref:VOC family protein n=1 Tax=Streptomyces sp. NPDC088560 TaxID=3365868 RepID=UPI0038283441